MLARTRPIRGAAGPGEFARRFGGFRSPAGADVTVYAPPMAIFSAGLLVFRRPRTAQSASSTGAPAGEGGEAGEAITGLEVLLGHPGGPLHRSKSLGCWSIPKGLIETGESAFAAARREFVEETGAVVPVEPEAYLPLGTIRYSNGKVVEAWATELDLDPAALRSNDFLMVWPPRSGRVQRFPEIDRFAYFDLAQARSCLLPAQVPFLDRLGERLAQRQPAASPAR